MTSYTVIRSVLCYIQNLCGKSDFFLFSKGGSETTGQKEGATNWLDSSYES